MISSCTPSSGDKNSAKALSLRGHEVNEQMKRCHSEVNDLFLFVIACVNLIQLRQPRISLPSVIPLLKFPVEFLISMGSMCLKLGTAY